MIYIMCMQKVTKIISQWAKPLFDANTLAYNSFVHVKGLKVDHYIMSHNLPFTRATDSSKFKTDVFAFMPSLPSFPFLIFSFCFVVSCKILRAFMMPNLG